MAAYDKQFLDNTGLNTTVNALWTKLKKVTPYYSEKGTDGTGGWVKFLTVKCQQYMNQPLVVHIISRGYSYSTMEIQWVSSGGATPTVSGFYHIIRSFNGTDGKSTNVGYTYEDIDSVRYYHFWKQKNEAYGIIHLSVDGISKYISGSDDTGYLTFPNEHSTTEPTGIVYATEVWDTVPKKTAVAASAKQVGYNEFGQVVLGNALTKSDVGLGNVDNTSDANKPISTATQTALDGKVSKSGDTMTGQLVNTVAVDGAIKISHGTANVTANVVAERTDTGVGVFMGVGSGGTNHGIYSNKNANWIIRADTSGNVYVNDTKATSTVHIGNSDVGSTTKPVYVDYGVIKAGSTYAGGTAVTLNGTSASGSTASFYAPTGSGTNRRFLRSNGSGAPSWYIPACDYTFDGQLWNTSGDTHTFWAFRLKGITNQTYNNILLSFDTYFWNNQKSSSDLIWIGWSNNGNQGLVATAGRFRIKGNDNTGTPLEYYLVKNTADTAAACTVDLYIRPASAGNSYGTFCVNVLNSGNRDLDDIIEQKGEYGVDLPEGAIKIMYSGTIGSADTLSTARELAVDLGNTSTNTTFDGSANVTNIKVSGTLPIPNGGTGKTTAIAARTALLTNMPEVDSQPNDATPIVMRYATPSDENGTLFTRTALNVWGYMKDKMSSDTGVNISGNAATATKLAAGKELAVSLSNTSTATTFDGSANVTNIKTTGTLGVGNGGTGMTSASYKNAVVIGNSSTVTNAMQTVRTGSGAFYATSQDGKPQFGTLPVAQGGTGATTAANARTNLSVYSKSEVDSMLTGRISVVASLPATGEPGVIYFVGPTGSGADQYEEYIWNGSAFVKVGEKSLDLSNYVNTLSSSGTGSVVTSLSKSGNTLTANLGNIAINNLSDWAAKSDVTISGVSYHVWWPTAPTSSNQVYGLSMKDGKLYQIYNNKGTYTARSYDQDNNTTYTNKSLGQGYGTCDTAAATAAKTATMADYSLTVGGIVAIKFTNALCASATLSINSKTAKPIYIKGAAVTADNAAAVSAGDLAYFMYDGTAYHLMGTDRAATNPIVNITRSGTTFTATRLNGSTFTFTQQDNNTTYTQEKLGQGYGTCSTAEATAAKVVALTDYELVKNGVVAIKFSYGLCAAATLNINSKGAKPVFINGAAATSTTCKEVQAGDIALFIYDGTQYHFLVSDRVSKSAITGLSISGKTITYTRADDSTGTITTQDTTYNFADNYNASTNKGATVATVTNAINALDVSDISGFGAGKTLATLAETNGKISATFQNISITKSQVSDFSHPHGNITDGGALQTTDITIASGDKLVVTDSSDSNKVARAAISFDGSTTTQALTKAGTWATFNNYSHPAGSAASKTGVPTADATPGFGGTFKVNQISTDSTSHVSAVTERTITIPNTTATTSAAGLMSAADKTKLNGIATGAEVNVQSDWEVTDNTSDAYIKNKPYRNKYIDSPGKKYKVCSVPKLSGGSTWGSGLEVAYRRGADMVYGHLIYKENFALYLEKSGDVSVNSNTIRFYYVVNSSDSSAIDIYVDSGSYCTLKVAPLLNGPKSDVNLTDFGTVVEDIPEGATEIIPVWVANASASSGTAPVKVDAYGTLTAVPMDSTPTASSTNLMTSGAIKTALGSYLPLSGGTMTGKINAWSSQYTDDGTTGAIDMKNSNIVGLNSIYTADASVGASEGIHFFRSTGKYDSLWMAGGHIYFVPNRDVGTSTNAASSKKVAILPASITSGHVVVTDGTSGDVKGVAASTLTVGVASKLGTADKGSTTKPIYLAAGVPTECSTYAGGTAVTLNNASKAGSTASFYAPTAGGTANYVLIGAGTTSAPTWAEKAPKASAADTAAKIATSAKIGDTNKPVYVAADGTITAISYTISTSVPSGAVFTDTKQNITLATTTKAFITGVSTTPTGTAQALTGLADTGVYLTTTAGQLHATTFDVNSKCTLQFNTTTNALDFVFA